MSKKNICLMYAIGCLQGMVFYGPIATLYRQAQGVTVFEITLIESISLALCLLLELPWGIVADKIGYKRTMVICCLLYFISKIVFWRADGFPAFLLERILLSVVIAGLSGVDTSILYLSTSKEDSQKVFGFYDGISTAGLLAAAFIYSTVIGENYRLAGFMTVISYGLAALLSLFLTEVGEEGKERMSIKGFFGSLKQTLTDKRLLFFLLGIAFLNETHQTVTVFLNQLLYVRAGMSNALMGYLYIVVTIVGIGGIFSAAITKKIGRNFLIRACYLTSASVCLLLAFTENGWRAAMGIIAFRLAFSLLSPLQMQIQNERIVTAERATALSINAVIIDSVGIGTNLIYGAMAEKSLTAALVSGGVLCAVGLGLVEIGRHETFTKIPVYGRIIKNKKSEKD